MNLHELQEDYEILGELGRGGTAIVYRARERELGRDVAIKVVRSSHSDDEEAVARLAREAKLVAMLRHPSIVPLLSIRRLSDGLALIMQHVPGRTLKAAIREHGPMPVSVVEHILREIGSALDYAHKRHNIVHRDIKPENIYLDEDINQALLADFGIARTTEGDSNLTLVGTALGTPAYMSPEQIDGTAIDGRSDLYSLGLVAYEMLTGQPPWAGHNLYTIIYKQKHEELPPIGSIRRDVPRYLERVVETLLRKNPAERYADAAQMIADIPSGAPASITLPAPSAAPAPARTFTNDDAPTIRYQRPTFTIVEHDAPHIEGEAQPEAAPAIEPEIVAEELVIPSPTVTPPLVVADETETEEATEPDAATQIAALIDATPARTGWRLPEPRNRPTLPPVELPAQVTEPAAVSAPFEFAAVAGDHRKKARLVAAMTVMLVLGGAATVVAMRNGRNAEEQPSDSAALQPIAIGSTPSLVKASGIPVRSPAESARPAANSARKDSAASSKASSDEDSEPIAPVPVPRITVPDLALTSAGRQVSTADFTSAVTASGVTPNISDAPTFTPHTVKPELRNREAVQRALSDYYPRVLRERKIGGNVGLWVLIDSEGKVIRSQVNESSGNPILDQAAIRVADVMTFTPALNRDQKVSVWIQLPIIFKTR
jgi:TonB family protein